MSDAHEGYSEKFREATAAAEYEGFYIAGTADHAIWTHERKILTDLLARHRKKWPACDYLDFACGTGRVIEFMERGVTTSRGIDISPEMLRLAAPKLQRSELICSDITKSDAPEGKYDLITAFRFFLNAEPSLRVAVIKALAARLKNSESILVLTNHGNPVSYKGALWPIHRTRQLLFGPQPFGNYLTHKQIKHLLDESGLHIVERFGCGIISPRLFKITPSIADSIERRFGRGKLARAIGVNQIYVVSKTSS
jgi:SAM-dependent methyltransferase